MTRQSRARIVVDGIGVGGKHNKNEINCVSHINVQMEVRKNWSSRKLPSFSKHCSRIAFYKENDPNRNETFFLEAHTNAYFYTHCEQNGATFLLDFLFIFHVSDFIIYCVW